MVKPPLRTKSIGFKVSEEEYAQLETAAQAERSDARGMVPRGDPAGRVGQRCSEARSGAGRDHRSALAAGERVAASGGRREAGPGSVRQNAGPNQRSETPARRQVAAGSPEETAARKTQRRGEAVISHFFAGECTERGSRVKALHCVPMNAHQTRALDSPPSPLL